ncbi:YrzI family small protein [Peribacillus kribbensis]|nr:YrzI family small protein [Peribacillus kribbensis]
MTVNLLFFTISFRKKTMSRKEAFHQETIKQWHEKNRTSAAEIRIMM